VVGVAGSIIASDVVATEAALGFGRAESAEVDAAKVRARPIACGRADERVAEPFLLAKHVLEQKVTCLEQLVGCDTAGVDRLLLDARGFEVLLLRARRAVAVQLELVTRNQRAARVAHDDKVLARAERHADRELVVAAARRRAVDERRASIATGVCGTE
jgi:hypothetical protein